MTRAAGERILTELLGVDAPRPAPQPGAAESLRRRIESGTSAALSAVAPGETVLVTKRRLGSVLSCEQLFAVEDSPGGGRLPAAVVVGLVVHRAAAMSHTHPCREPGDYVEQAIAALRRERRSLAEWWAEADMAEESDVVVASTNAVSAWLWNWPAMEARWNVRFEATIRVTVGGVVLHGRPDLTLGRPRPDAVPSMVIGDLKVGMVRDSHRTDARLYALLSTLRHGVPPARSFAYSLVTGSWTAPPEISAEDLDRSADEVVAATVKIVEVAHVGRTPSRTAGPWCTWCPLRPGCPEAKAAAEAGTAGQTNEAAA